MFYEDVQEVLGLFRGAELSDAEPLGVTFPEDLLCLSRGVHMCAFYALFLARSLYSCQPKSHSAGSKRHFRCKLLQDIFNQVFEEKGLG